MAQSDMQISMRTSKGRGPAQAMAIRRRKARPPALVLRFNRPVRYRARSKSRAVRSHWAGGSAAPVWRRPPVQWAERSAVQKLEPHLPIVLGTFGFQAVQTMVAGTVMWMDSTFLHGRLHHGRQQVCMQPYPPIPALYWPRGSGRPRAWCPQPSSPPAFRAYCRILRNPGRTVWR